MKIYVLKCIIHCIIGAGTQLFVNVDATTIESNRTAWGKVEKSKRVYVTLSFSVCGGRMQQQIQTELKT